MHDEPTPHETGSPSGRSPRSEGRKLSIRPGLVVAVLVAVGLIFFVVQNNAEVAFAWLIFDMSGPLWVVIVVAAVAGAVLNEVLGWMRRRSRRRR